MGGFFLHFQFVIYDMSNIAQQLTGLIEFLASQSLWKTLYENNEKRHSPPDAICYYFRNQSA